MLIFGQALISNYVFLLLKAENFREYTDSFYATATLTIAAVNFVIAILKMAESVRFIENCENTIEKSKCSEPIKIVMTPANQWKYFQEWEIQHQKQFTRKLINK